MGQHLAVQQSGVAVAQLARPVESSVERLAGELPARDQLAAESLRPLGEALAKAGADRKGPVLASARHPLAGPEELDGAEAELGALGPPKAPPLPVSEQKEKEKVVQRLAQALGRRPEGESGHHEQESEGATVVLVGGCLPMSFLQLAESRVQPLAQLPSGLPH